MAYFSSVLGGYRCGDCGLPYVPTIDTKCGGCGASVGPAAGAAEAAAMRPGEVFGVSDLVGRDDDLADLLRDILANGRPQPRDEIIGKFLWVGIAEDAVEAALDQAVEAAGSVVAVSCGDLVDLAAAMWDVTFTTPGDRDDWESWETSIDLTIVMALVDAGFPLVLDGEPLDLDSFRDGSWLESEGGDGVVGFTLRGAGHIEVDRAISPPDHDPKLLREWRVGFDSVTDRGAVEVRWEPAIVDVLSRIPSKRMAGRCLPPLTEVIEVASYAIGDGETVRPTRLAATLDPADYADPWRWVRTVFTSLWGRLILGVFFLWLLASGGLSQVF